MEQQYDITIRNYMYNVNINDVNFNINFKDIHVNTVHTVHVHVCYNNNTSHCS